MQEIVFALEEASSRRSKLLAVRKSSTQRFHFENNGTIRNGPGYSPSASTGGSSWVTADDLICNPGLEDQLRDVLKMIKAACLRSLMLANQAQTLMEQMKKS